MHLNLKDDERVQRVLWEDSKSVRIDFSQLNKVNNILWLQDSIIHNLEWTNPWRALSIARPQSTNSKRILTAGLLFKGGQRWLGLGLQSLVIVCGCLSVYPHYALLSLCIILIMHYPHYALLSLCIIVIMYYCHYILSWVYICISVFKQIKCAWEKELL